MREPGSPAARPAPPLLAALIESGAWRLYPLLLVYITGLCVVLPIVPTLMTDDFASRRAGAPTRCEAFAPGAAPAACRDAHADVVWWSTASGFVSNTFVAILVGPALGAASDRHGRRPFLLGAQALALLPLGVLLANVQAGLPLRWYYVTQVATSSVSIVTLALAYLADVLPPVRRAAGFGGVMATFSLGVLVGPPLGALLAPRAAILAAAGVTLGCMAATALALPESCALDARAAARAGAGGGGGALPSRAALALLMRSTLFRRLTVVLMLSSAAMEGLQDLLLQYLQLKLGFGPKDTAAIFMIFGAGALATQGLALRPLLAALGEQRCLLVGLAAYAGQQAALAAAATRGQALAAVALGSVGSLTFPTISSIKANNAGPHEQGSVQGALFAARSLASGVGPLGFAWVFALFSRADSALPYLPGAPFVLGFAVMAVAIAVAASLPANAGGSAGTLGGGAAASRHAGGGGDDDERKRMLRPESALDGGGLLDADAA